MARGKKILIMGGTGFIGINLTYELIKDPENRVRIYGRQFGNFPDELRSNQQVELKNGDYRSDSGFEELTKDQDIVFHLISTTVPTTSNQNIAKEITDNIERTSVLIEACIKNKIGKFIFISSGGTVYGITDSQKIGEHMETNPITSYGMQKLAIEKLLYLYSHMSGLDYRVIRLANPYGPYQKVNGVQGVVATFLYKTLHGDRLTVYGDGSVVRDYLYIDDAVRAIINITFEKSKERIYNVGSGEGASINDIICAISDVLGTNPQVHYVQSRSVDVPANILDISRYETEFGQIGKIGLKAGIKRTAEYIKSRSEQPG